MQLSTYSSITYVKTLFLSTEHPLFIPGDHNALLNKLYLQLLEDRKGVRFLSGFFQGGFHGYHIGIPDPQLFPRVYRICVSSFEFHFRSFHI